MVLILIGIASLLSALIFDTLPIPKIGKSVLNLQKQSLKVITGSEHTDTEKQKMMFSISGQILYATIKLIFLFLLVALPVISLIVIGQWISVNNNFYHTLISPEGICISTLAFIVYYFIKKSYARFRL